MASPASQWSALRRRLLCLLAVASCVELRAAERSSSADASSNGGIASGGAGAAETGSCMEVKKMVTKGKMPLGVYNLLTKKGAMQEYKGLVDYLSFSKRGKLNALKCSTLYRAMYIGRHEENFRRKGVSIFLTKQDKEGILASMRKSLIQVCFAEGANAPPPEHVYHDGREIKLEGHTYHAMRSFPEGAVAQPYNRKYGEPMILSTKATMPVDLLRLLESKDRAPHQRAVPSSHLLTTFYRPQEPQSEAVDGDPLLLHADMAALINIHQFDPKHAKAVVGRFREKFRELGIGLSFRESVIAKKYEEFSDTGYWIQYVDLDVLDVDLNPVKLQAPPSVAEPDGVDSDPSDPVNQELSSPEEIQDKIEALQQKLREKLRGELSNAAADF